MHRALLVAALIVVVAGCSKKEDKASPAAASGSGSGSASGSSTATGSGSGTGTGTGTGSADAEAKDKIAQLEAEADKHVDSAEVDDGPSPMAMLGFGGGAAAAASDGDVVEDKVPEDKPADKKGKADTAPDTKAPMAKINIPFPDPIAAGGDCAAVAGRLDKIMSAAIDAQLAQMPEDQRAEAKKMVEQQMGGDMAAMVEKMCKDQKWPQELIDCVDASTDQDSFMKCQKYAPKGMGKPKPVDAPASEQAPVAEWTGGHECKDVGERLRQMTLAQVGDIPESEQAEVNKALDDQVTGLVETCTKSGWTDKQRDCVVHSATMDAVAGCFQ